MTKLEASTYLDKMIDNIKENNKEVLESLELLKTLKECVKKQTAQKPILEGDEHDAEGNLICDTWVCPCCETSYEVYYYDDYLYCPNCGQKIDRSVFYD